MEAHHAIAAACVGAPFGFALHAGRVTDPDVIRAQFEHPYENFTMMKMFLTATATGAGVFAFGSLAGIEMITPSASHLRFLRPTANFMGGALLGIGMHR
jgi:hypothetical protein